MPMLVIFDHELPNMNAGEFIGELIKEELVYSPGIMVLAKNYSDELHNSYKQIGVDEVFSKPFDLSKFKHKLDRHTGVME